MFDTIFFVLGCIYIWICKIYVLPLLQYDGRNIVYMAKFIIFDEKPAGEGFAMGFTNMVGLSEFTRIPYDTLVLHFTRKKKRWHFYRDQGIKVIKVDTWEKGRQRVIWDGTHNRNI